MTREHILLILGALVLISPWSGLPLSWLTWVLPVIGLAVIGIGVTLRARNQAHLPPVETPIQIASELSESGSSHIAFS